MTNQKQNKQSEKKGNVSPVVAAVAGAVVGAGIAVAGVVLSEEKNRNKIKDVSTKVKNDVVKNIDNIRNRAEIEKQKLEARIFKDKEKVRKVVNSAKNLLDKTTNKAVTSL